MQVGVGRITLDFYNNDSLKVKRRQLESLCKDLRKKYNLSAMEIAEQDDLETCVIGFAAVIPETWETKNAYTFVQEVARHIDNTAFARVTISDVDLLSFGN